MLKRTPLYENHVKLGARLVEFGGWEMPVQYTGIVEEHHAVRRHAGLFDIAHMGQIQVTGPGAKEWLNGILTNDLRKIQPGQSQYTLMCQASGGVIDDLYAYCLGPEEYLLMVNASRRDEDWAWLQQAMASSEAGPSVLLRNRGTSHGAVAIQGPRVIEFIHQMIEPTSATSWSPLRLDEMKKNQIGAYSHKNQIIYLARTGYTGEDGFELMAPAELLPTLWDKCLEAGRAFGLKPAGLGARDTLRTEMGYPLYGHELDTQTTPVEAGLERFIGWDKPFIGRESLLTQKQQGVIRKCVAFRLTDQGPPPRPQYPIWSCGAEATPIGRVVSGTQSPSLGIGIGLGYVPPEQAKPGTPIAIEVRGQKIRAEIAAKPLYRPPVTH
jgi:aminomethyltransferase